MSRARVIKPGFFRNEELCELHPLARLLFAGLWTLADRAGRLEDRPKRIKVELLPYDDVDVNELLKQLSTAGFIARYEANGARYITIPTWQKHQNPHVKEAASTIPAPCEHSASTVLEPDSPDASPGDSGTSPASSLSLSLSLSSSLDDQQPSSASVAPEQPRAAPRARPIAAETQNGKTSREQPRTNGMESAGQFARRAPPWQLDEGFAAFVEAYRESGAALIDEDFAEAYHPWQKLNTAGRLQRVAAFRAKLECGEYSEPAFIPRPRRFVEVEWKRPPMARAPTAANGSKAEKRKEVIIL